MASPPRRHYGFSTRGNSEYPRLRALFLSFPMMKPTSPSLKPSGNRIKPAFHRNALQHQTDCRASIVGRLCQTPIQPVRRFTEMPYNATALKPNRDKAVALIIVLAFVVLLTGLAVAFLSRGTNNRQVAQSSFH